MRGTPLNPAFWEWFGDSQVRDAAGQPLVVYHGTSALDDFDTFRVHSEMGAHFGTARQAEGLVERLVDSSSSRALAGRRRWRIIRAYLSIQHPLRLEDWGLFTAPFVVQQLQHRGLLPWERRYDFWQPFTVQQWLRQQGYDGLVYLNRREGYDEATYADILEAEHHKGDRLSDAEWRARYPLAADSWVVFSPQQIKSVWNQGTWAKDEGRMSL